RTLRQRAPFVEVIVVQENALFQPCVIRHPEYANDRKMPIMGSVFFEPDRRFDGNGVADFPTILLRQSAADDGAGADSLQCGQLLRWKFDIGKHLEIGGYLDGIGEDIVLRILIIAAEPCRESDPG